MTKTSINNKDIFYKRADINEFLREHPFVSDLYDATLQALYAQGQPQTEALRVFNQAYFMCTLITEHGGDKHTILRLINDPDFEKDNDEYPLIGLNLMVVKCLLRVHQELLPFDSSIIAWLGSVISVQVDSSLFSQAVKNYAGEFSTPLNFCGKYVEVPVEETQGKDDPYYMLNCAQQLIKDATDKLSTSDEDKDKRIKELEELLRLEKEKNNTLTMQLAANEMEEPSRVKFDNPTEEEARINEVVNYRTIHDYACGLSKEDHALVISNMLGKLAMRYNLSSPLLNQLALNIDEVQQTKNTPNPVQQIVIDKLILNNTEINNDNKDSQVFNGKIDNSSFGK